MEAVWEEEVTCEQLILASVYGLEFEYLGTDVGEFIQREQLPYVNGWASGRAPIWINLLHSVPAGSNS